MPAIQLLKQQLSACFSLNPIDYLFRVTPFNANSLQSRQRIHIKVRMAFDYINQLYTDIWQGSIIPDNKGMCTIDVSSIIDAQLEYFTPKLFDFQIRQCDKQYALFVVNYYLYDDTGILSDIYETTPIRVYKGGISKENFLAQKNFLNDNLISNERTLHYHHAQESIRQQQPAWVFFIAPHRSPTSISYVELRAVAIQDDGDGNETGPDGINLTLTEGALYCMPIDMASTMLLFDANNINLVSSYTIHLRDQNNVDVFEPFTLQVDQRPMRNEVYIAYRNSLGGLDTIAILGDKEYGINLSSDRSEMVQLSELLGSAIMQPEYQEYHNTYHSIIKANTGWISLAQLQRLRDLLLNRTCITPYNRRWQPIVINTKSTTLYKNSDALYSLQLEYSNAYDDTSYSPEATVEMSDSCPNVQFIEGLQLVGGYCQITWQLPVGYTRMELEWSINSGATESAILLGTSGTYNLYVNAPGAFFITDSLDFRGRVICNDQLVTPSLGPWSFVISISIVNMMGPVALPETVDISPRNTTTRTLQIAGLPANILANDYARTVVGAPLTVVAFCDAGGATVTTSNNGASLSLVSNTVIYSPNSTSLAILDEDYFYYKCAENYAPYGDIESEVAKVTVPLAGNIPTIYVRMQFLNLEETTHKYGVADYYQIGTIAGDAYIRFYSDAACTKPIDVTLFGLTISYHIKEYSDSYDSLGALQTTSALSIESSNAVTATGFSMPLGLGFEFSKFDGAGWGCNLQYRNFYSNAGSSSLNVVFVNF